MRLYLAAPSDLAAEREAVANVVAALNESVRSGVAEAIEIVDWHQAAAPVTSLPETVAFRNLPVQPEDFFVALSWLGFDAPDAKGESLCTERDLEIAYNYWKTLRRPRCVFLRCMRLPTSLAAIDSRAFDRVGHFHRRFDSPEKNRFAYHEFDTAASLEATLGAELRQLLQGDAAAPTAPAEAKPRPTLVGQTRFEKKMEPGKAYEVSFLSIEIARWDKLLEELGDDSALLQRLAAGFLELVKSTAATYGGEVFAWGSQGGLVMFWARRSYDHAIMTGLKVLHNLPVFNLDPEQNPLGRDIDLRASAHDAVIVFQLPIEEIQASDLRFVVDLQKRNTDAGELTITRRLLERIDERLRPHFSFKGRWEREPVYSCKLPSSRADGDLSDLDDAVARMQRQTSLALALLQGPASGLDIQAADALSGSVDEMYSVLNSFCQSYASIDYNWSQGFFAQLAEAAARMRKEEGSVWLRLREQVADAKAPLVVSRRLEAMARAASRRRSRSVVILEKLEHRCLSLARGAEEPSAPTAEIDDEVLRAIDQLLRADELDIETALTEVLLNHKKAVLAYLQTNPGEERHAKLLKKLWEAADLVLLDDLFSIRGHKRADDTSFVDVLLAPPVEHRRFHIVRELLASTERPDAAALAERFEGSGLRPSEQDFQIVWRCLVLGHGEQEVRNHAALQLSPQAMWQVVSHPSIPITSIYAIGERMSRKEGEDARKIFFDCTRSRIEQAVEGFRTREEFDAVTKLIMLLLGFSFLVETGYFERFDDILRRFLARAQSKGLKVDYFERLRRTLEAARRESGDKGPSKPPAGIKSLPLTIQRRLAGAARYIYWFVTHPDPRVASETLRHIGLMHVERVLRLREINSAVLQTILRRPELFTRQQALVAALNHPKCTQEFANKYIGNMTRSRQGRQILDKIAQNPSASPVVRSTAKRAMAAVAQRQKR
ncbi:MAG: hypothetical protein AAGC60_24040 [Acidobacteriota bacterium]